jgi:hypothetical protein
VGAALVVLAVVNLISFGGGTFNPFTIAMKLFSHDQPYQRDQMRLIEVMKIFEKIKFYWLHFYSNWKSKLHLFEN